MKNLFIITESEKSRILQMHKNAIKRQYLNEDLQAVEPVLSQSTIATFDQKGIPSGTAIVDQTKVDTFVLSAKTIISKSCKTVQTFSDINSKYKIPKMFELYIGTDSIGDGKDNTATYNKRLAKAQEIIRKAVKDSGCNLTDSLITDLLDNKSEYVQTKVNLNVSNKKPDPNERFIKIIVHKVDEAGLVTNRINQIANDLRDAKGWNINPSENKIRDAFCKLETYSDIQDLDDNLGGLQQFINKTITSNILWNDDAEREAIKDCLNNAARRSGKGNIAMTVNGGMTVDIPKRPEKN